MGQCEQISCLRSYYRDEQTGVCSSEDIACTYALFVVDILVLEREKEAHGILGGLIKHSLVRPILGSC